MTYVCIYIYICIEREREIKLHQGRRSRVLAHDGHAAAAALARTLFRMRFPHSICYVCLFMFVCSFVMLLFIIRMYWFIVV